MEDENGLELSLGLSCGSSGGKSKGKDSSSDTKTEEGVSNKLMGGSLNVGDASFKHFIHHGKHELLSGSQRSEPGTQQRENFWTDLGKCSGQESTNVSSDVHGNSSQFARYQELWGGNKRSSEIVEEKLDQHEIGSKLWPDTGNKRKMSFDDMKHQKKHEREVEHAEALGKTHMGVAGIVKSSHVSEDGSFAENEDVAESEAEVSTSKLVSQHDDGAKQYKGSGSDASQFKEKQGFSESHVNVVGNESGLELGNLPYGIQFSLQQQSATSSPYALPVKIPTTAAASNSAGVPFPCVMQLMPNTNSERPTIQSINPSNFQMAFGYSAVQLPTLNADSSSGSASHPQQLSAFSARSLHNGVANADHSNDNLKISQAAVSIPHHAPEETGASSSSHKEDYSKGNNTIFKSKEISDRPASVESISHDGSTIRPGIAADLKFGGSGSYPDLPWVSTTAPGPNGKTISGVTYRYGQNQIRILCACHGSHMSPEEFVQHASSEAPNQENNAGLASFPGGNPAASAAQS
ncbi:ninja-family protein mc410 [Magnolia sinica]|uniref:ninja-family protein mc410 n=1 Tax=Magnolia sinica TaxID=86752 RepID=UPI00265B381E|nr:ninja-family protein mc410 [Magnolia sinica]XP_058114533.1 ninja-family protein mc410 [Magnolia sinica]